MLHEALAAYLERVEQTILRCRSANVERYVEEVITPERTPVYHPPGHRHGCTSHL